MITRFLSSIFHNQWIDICNFTIQRLWENMYITTVICLYLDFMCLKNCAVNQCDKTELIHFFIYIASFTLHCKAKRLTWSFIIWKVNNTAINKHTLSNEIYSCILHLPKFLIHFYLILLHDNLNQQFDRFTSLLLFSK